jgi:hypothetical protein
MKEGSSMAEDTKGDDQQIQQALEPVEQEEVPFKGETIVAVRLPDGRICVVVRWVCQSLHLDPQGQVQRIQRTAATASELVRVKVQTKGGRQTMPAITLRGFSPWILGINPSEVKGNDPTEDERIRDLIVAYQEEAKDALYEYFMSKGRPGLPAPAGLVPAEPIKRPPSPEPGATLDEWRTYYQQMLAFIDWQMDVESWRGSMESRVEGIEALIPDILDRLPPVTITPEHQRLVQVYVKQLSTLTGKHSGTIYDDLKTAFSVPRYQEVLEADWEDVEKWFKGQIDKAKARKRGKP